jgi:hypothetical protein
MIESVKTLPLVEQNCPYMNSSNLIHVVIIFSKLKEYINYKHSLIVACKNTQKNVKNFSIFSSTFLPLQTRKQSLKVCLDEGIF